MDVGIFPGAAVDILVDALDVEEAFDGDEGLGIEAEISNTSLVPAGKAKLGAINFATWMSSQVEHA